MGLQDGGKACVLYFSRISRLCEHFLDSMADLKRKPFSIADVVVSERPEMPEPVNKLKRTWYFHNYYDFFRGVFRTTCLEFLFVVLTITAKSVRL